MWEINSSEQIITFLLSICFGVGYSFLYDIFKSVRMVHTGGKISIFFEDIVYSVIITFLTFCLCILRTNGQPRMFVLFGLAVGFVILHSVLSKPICRTLATVFRFLIKIKTIVFSVLRVTFLKIGIKTAEIFKKFIKTLKKGLKGAKRLLYNLFNKNIKIVE